MPKFEKVLWTSAISATYDPRKRTTLDDSFESKVFEPAIETAESNHKLWSEHILKLKNQGKVILDGIEDVLDRVKSADEREADKLLKDVERASELLTQLAQDAKETNKDYANCFSVDGFRENSLADAIDKIDKTKVLDAGKTDRQIKSLKARREKLIVADRTLVAERNRVEEYAERGAAILKAATTLASGEKLERSSFKKELQKIDAAFDGDMGIDAAIRKLREKMDQGYSAAKSGPRDLADQKLSVGTTEYPAHHKNLAGAAKTAVIQLQTLKATYGKKLWSKFAISGMEKRLMLTIDEIKKLGAEAELYERKMKKLIAEHLEGK